MTDSKWENEHYKSHKIHVLVSVSLHKNCLKGLMWGYLMWGKIR